jgi:hypothetical protein
LKDDNFYEKIETARKKTSLFEMTLDELTELNKKIKDYYVL